MIKKIINIIPPAAKLGEIVAVVVSVVAATVAVVAGADVAAAAGASVVVVDIYIIYTHKLSPVYLCVGAVFHSRTIFFICRNTICRISKIILV